MRNPQLTFWNPLSKAHGGANSVGREKKARPIATKKPMHLIFRSSRAKGAWSFLHSRNRELIETHLAATARRFGIKVYRFANVGNHFHLLVQARRREDLQNFLRVFAQGVVFLVTKARKGNPIGKFWDALAYSRIVEWGKDWKNMLDYVGKNLLEARGFPRDRLDAWFGLKREVMMRSLAIKRPTQ
jgi:REP element-mobilizing transposase RayT